ncbi:MAG: PAS domain S-box protein [Desulfobaccales bacterium]|jgi:PAS domain S-box-containing protein
MQIKTLLERVKELEELLDVSERKADILTNLLKEANAEFEHTLEMVTISQANFRAVFENAPEAIFIVDGEAYRILDCNDFATKWLGYRREELLSLSFDDLIEASSQQNVLRLGSSYKGIQECRFRKKRGVAVDSEVTGTMLEFQGRRCMVVLVRDVTERKQLDELARYKELFENVTDPVFINNLQGRILEVNDVACERFGYSREEFFRMSLKRLAGPDQLALLQETRAQIEEGLTIQFEMETITKTGEWIPVEFHARGITYRGQPAVLGVARDLSFRKKLQQTLVEKARLTAVGEMASGIAHNFNNLLQMILGATEASLGKLEAGKIRECREALQRIQATSQRGGEIVRRLKDFTTTGFADSDAADSFALAELIREAVELTKPLWKNLPDVRKIEVYQDLDPDCLVQGRPSEIYEVLVNLILNAVEAMPKGGSLLISTRVRDEKVWLQVSDTGVGITAENLERLFQPFFSTKGLKSSGLGLSSSYGIITRHQGEIQVESTVGQGTTFTVTLPLAHTPARMKVAALVDLESPKIKFLIIEDEINIVKSMELFFEETEVELVACRTGTEGLEVYLNHQFDVVLCDLGLDDLNGWEVGKQIKDHCQVKGLRKTPFLLYTGWDKKFDPEQLAESGVDRLVTKPVSCADLLRLLREAVAHNNNHNH